MSSGRKCGLDTNEKGALAESAFASHAVRAGFGVFLPFSHYGRVDLILETPDRLVRVQCKWGSLVNGAIRASTTTNRFSPTRGRVSSRYEVGEVDALGVYCDELNRSFLVPIEVFHGLSAIHLRVDPPANNQQRSINWAAQYELGAVAQLEERRHGMAEVRGSIPLSSISRDPDQAGVSSREVRPRLIRAG